MHLRSAGDRVPTRWEKTLLKAMARLRRRLSSTIEVDDRGGQLRFVAENLTDAFRPLSLWIKEPGTMAWIDREVRAGDRFLDIGANIGIYTIAAGRRVGAEGKVYAVEPHKANVLTLMRNIAANGFEDRVEVLPFALADVRKVLRFNYVSLESASTGSQLGSNRVETSNETFTPVASELLPAMTVDDLIAEGAIERPSLVKIDVDGIELAILKGMRGLLGGPERPRSVQIEVNRGESRGIDDFMTACGYRLKDRHFTMSGERRAGAGIDPDLIAHNAEYSPA